MSTTIRISPGTSSALDELSRQNCKPKTVLVTEAVEMLRRHHVHEQARIAFAELRQDTEAWEEYQSEVELWDETSLDGLEEQE